MTGKRISAELIGILAVGVALGGLMLNGLSVVDKRLDGLEGELRRLGVRVAHIEGMIEGAALFRPTATPAPDSTGD